MSVPWYPACGLYVRIGLPEESVPLTGLKNRPPEPSPPATDTFPVWSLVTWAWYEWLHPAPIGPALSPPTLVYVRTKRRVGPTPGIDRSSRWSVTCPS